MFEGYHGVVELDNQDSRLTSEHATTRRNHATPHPVGLTISDGFRPT